MTRGVPHGQEAARKLRSGQIVAHLQAGDVSEEAVISAEKRIESVRDKCVAALAGCGLGKEDPLPNEADRAQLRTRAREWLRAEMLKTRVAHGYCSRQLAAEACPYANICEQCDNYVTAPEFIPQLQAQLAETEDKIAVSRQVYNDTVLTFNNAIQTFPTLLFAGLFGDDIFVRADEATQGPIRAHGGWPFAPMPGRPMRDYVVLPPAWTTDETELRSRIGASLAFTMTLPPKASKAAPSAASRWKVRIFSSASSASSVPS